MLAIDLSRSTETFTPFFVRSVASSFRHTFLYPTDIEDFRLKDLQLPFTVRPPSTTTRRFVVLSSQETEHL